MGRSRVSQALLMSIVAECQERIERRLCSKSIYLVNELPMHPEPAGLGMKSPSHSQRYVPISFTHRPLTHIPVTEHSSISRNKVNKD